MAAVVGRWMKQFKEGWLDVHNMPWSGRPSDSMTFFDIEIICNLLEEDRSISILEICSHLQLLDCANGSVHKIIYDVLGFCKLWSWWVSRLLANYYKKHHLKASLSFLMSYHREGLSLLDCIAMGDKT